MENTEILPKEKVSFIKSFSKNEWLLNSWKKEDQKVILHVFEMIALFVKDGNYLELGCGTGLLCRFLFLFSGKKIIPHGIDYNLEAVKIAKKNNLEFADNFIGENYFESLKSNTFDLNKFSTISIFVSRGNCHWSMLREIMTPIVKNFKKINFLICDHDDDFILIKEKEIKKFISAMKKISLVSVASHNLLVISKDEKKHIIADKLRKNALKYLKYTELNLLPRITINGIIVEKNPSSFSLIEADNFKYKKGKKLKFFLTSNFRFTTTIFSHSGKMLVQKTINWKDIKNGDSVNVMFGKYRQKNIVYAITKIKYDSK
jgi:SAM-dependent methyltransferase